MVNPLYNHHCFTCGALFSNNSIASIPICPSCFSKVGGTKKPLLQRANELIGGDRQKDYGGKLQNFSQIAMLWTGTFATKLAPGQAFTAEDVALGMMQVKIARLAKSPDHEDSILDVAGYAGCYEAVQNERAAFDYPMLGATVDTRAITNSKR